MKNKFGNSTYLFTRKYKRRGSFGMRIKRAWTVTQGSVAVDHFELSCPGYELTSEGPVIIGKRKNEVVE